MKPNIKATYSSITNYSITWVTCLKNTLRATSKAEYINSIFSKLRNPANGTIL